MINQNPCDASAVVCNSTGPPSSATPRAAGPAGANTGAAGSTTVDATAGTTAGAADAEAGASSGDAVPVGIGPSAEAIEALDQNGAALAETVFTDLSERTTELGQPVEIDIGGLETSLNTVAGLVVFVAASIGLVVAMTRGGRNLRRLSGSVSRYMIVSLLGVVGALAAAELANEMTLRAVAVAIPEVIDTSGTHLYSGGFASLIVPLLIMVLDFQPLVVGALIGLWPLAAALSLFESYRSAMAVTGALLAANIVWPPFAALCIGKAFASLPDVALATWWTMGVLALAVLMNVIALAAVSHGYPSGEQK